MGSGHFKEATTTSATMVDIKHLLSFSMGETKTKDNINAPTIKIVTDEVVARGLKSNRLLIITSEVGGEFLGLQIGKYVTIPRVI